tara:strand:- start:1023 stop:1814 length:792 start_codon:yes stop_codon:yes gene_type:complete
MSINNYFNNVRQISPKIISMLICFIFLFYLLQFVQSSGFGPSETIPDNAEAQISNSPLGFSEADSQILSVNIIMKSEATPFIAPIENQLVEVFWQIVDVNTTELRTLSVSTSTDENGNVIFELLPGYYTLQVDYNGIKKNESIIITPDEDREINWIISKYSISTYRIEFKDKNNQGVIYPKEIILLVYEEGPQLDKPLVIELYKNSTSASQKISSFTIVNIVNKARASIIEITPNENFIISEFKTESPPEVIMYSIDIENIRG